VVKKYKEWRPRKGPTKIGRAIYINPSCGELYYLRMLLNVAKGATSYEDLRTISGVLYQHIRMRARLWVFLAMIVSGVRTLGKHLCGDQLLRCGNCLLL
jgi:hypothetical protein